MGNDVSYRAEEATPGEQTFYWSASVTLLITSLILHALVIYEWQFNPSYRKHMFRGFIPMFIGNITFAISYVFQHSFSLSIGTLFTDQTYCEFIAYFAGTWIIAFSWAGMTCVAYTLNGTVKAALNGEVNKVVITPKVLAGFLITPLLFSSVHYAIGFDTIGPYRALYCQFYAFTYKTGFVGIFWFFICGNLTVYYFYNTYKRLDGHFSLMDAHSSSASDQRARTINGVTSISLKILVVFLVAGLPTLVDTLCSMFELQYTIVITMISGLAFKVKTCLDPLLILTMPSIVRSRKDSFLFHGITKNWCGGVDRGTQVVSSQKGTGTAGGTMDPQSLSESV